MLQIVSLSSHITAEGPAYSMEVIAPNGAFRVDIHDATYDQLQQILVESPAVFSEMQREQPQSASADAGDGSNGGLTLEDVLASSQHEHAEMVAMAPPTNGSPPPEDDSSVVAMGGDRLVQSEELQEPNALEALQKVGFFSEDGVDREELDALDLADDEEDIGEHYIEEDDDQVGQL